MTRSFLHRHSRRCCQQQTLRHFPLDPSTRACVLVDQTLAVGWEVTRGEAATSCLPKPIQLVVRRQHRLAGV